MAHYLDGTLCVYQKAPLVGTGDHFYFPASPDIYFEQVPMFEKLEVRGKKPIKQYMGLLYFRNYSAP